MPRRDIPSAKATEGRGRQKDAYGFLTEYSPTDLGKITPQTPNLQTGQTQYGEIRFGKDVNIIGGTNTSAELANIFGAAMGAAEDLTKATSTVINTHDKGIKEEEEEAWNAYRTDPKNDWENKADDEKNLAYTEHLKRWEDKYWKKSNQVAQETKITELSLQQGLLTAESTIKRFEGRKQDILNDDTLTQEDKIEQIEILVNDYKMMLENDPLFKNNEEFRRKAELALYGLETDAQEELSNDANIFYAEHKDVMDRYFNEFYHEKGIIEGTLTGDDAENWTMFLSFLSQQPEGVAIAEFLQTQSDLSSLYSEKFLGRFIQFRKGFTTAISERNRQQVVGEVTNRLGSFSKIVAGAEGVATKGEEALNIENLGPIFTSLRDLKDHTNQPSLLDAQILQISTELAKSLYEYNSVNEKTPAGEDVQTVHIPSAVQTVRETFLNQLTAELGIPQEKINGYVRIIQKALEQGNLAQIADATHAGMMMSKTTDPNTGSSETKVQLAPTVTNATDKAEGTDGPSEFALAYKEMSETVSGNITFRVFLESPNFHDSLVDLVPPNTDMQGAQFLAIRTTIQRAFLDPEATPEDIIEKIREDLIKLGSSDSSLTKDKVNTWLEKEETKTALSKVIGDVLESDQVRCMTEHARAHAIEGHGDRQKALDDWENRWKDELPGLFPENNLSGVVWKDDQFVQSDHVTDFQMFSNAFSGDPDKRRDAINSLGLSINRTTVEDMQTPKGRKLYGEHLTKLQQTFGDLLTTIGITDADKRANYYRIWLDSQFPLANNDSGQGDQRDRTIAWMLHLDEARRELDASLEENPNDEEAQRIFDVKLGRLMGELTTYYTDKSNEMAERLLRGLTPRDTGFLSEANRNNPVVKKVIPIRFADQLQVELGSKPMLDFLEGLHFEGNLSGMVASFVSIVNKNPNINLEEGGVAFLVNFLNTQNLNIYPELNQRGEVVSWGLGVGDLSDASNEVVFAAGINMQDPEEVGPESMQRDVSNTGFIESIAPQMRAYYDTAEETGEITPRGNNFANAAVSFLSNFQNYNPNHLIAVISGRVDPTDIDDPAAVAFRAACSFGPSPTDMNYDDVVLGLQKLFDLEPRVDEERYRKDYLNYIKGGRNEEERPDRNNYVRYGSEKKHYKYRPTLNVTTSQLRNLEQLLKADGISGDDAFFTAGGDPVSSADLHRSIGYGGLFGTGSRVSSTSVTDAAGNITQQVFHSHSVPIHNRTVTRMDRQRAMYYAMFISPEHNRRYYEAEGTIDSIWSMPGLTLWGQHYLQQGYNLGNNPSRKFEETFEALEADLNREFPTTAIAKQKDSPNNPNLKIKITEKSSTQDLWPDTGNNGFTYEKLEKDSLKWYTLFEQRYNLINFFQGTDYLPRVTRLLSELQIALADTTVKGAEARLERLRTTTGVIQNPNAVGSNPNRLDRTNQLAQDLRTLVVTIDNNLIRDTQRYEDYMKIINSMDAAHLNPVADLTLLQEIPSPFTKEGREWMPKSKPQTPFPTKHPIVENEDVTFIEWMSLPPEEKEAYLAMSPEERTEYIDNFQLNFVPMFGYIPPYQQKK